MKLEILGHLTGVPTEAGACSSYVVSDEDETTHILLDCGTGTLPLLQKKGLEQNLDAIVISHMHEDHFWDLLSFTTLRLIHGLRNPTAEWRKAKLFVPQEGGLEVLEVCEKVSSKSFSDTFEIQEYAEEDALDIGSLQLTFRRTRHALPCFAARVSDGERHLVYTADTGYSPEVAAHAEGADLLLCEATFVEPNPLVSEEHGHLTAEEAGRIAEEADVTRLVLTHLGLDPELDDLRLRAAKKRFKGVTDLARKEAAYYI